MKRLNIKIETEAEERRFKTIKGGQVPANMATINREHLQNMNPGDTKNLSFATFIESGEVYKEKKLNCERPEPLEQEEKNIPAHFYHKPGSRDLARGNCNKTKRYSHVNF